ncbi:aspartyl-phosphate phosphatase Spo0E family protein [Bacillus sp. BHET2]|uniref:aspartyl-phosphate phosphatase Spo0E family protein n=1 Tax=Bacillus sp. BHET2 TaxID=2583818 RepID=UPI00110EDB5E|nr:aspartyl-phosphate phosphatase Spo0E family protein [Bacillus sp. BHET2]TMU84103.1 aspartyl-phosphate phosphatase Spo0E family protein [Bacillus sp. BHET2]
MTTSTQTNSTLKVIEQKRIELQKIAHLFGFTHPATLRLSEELDTLFNLYESTKKRQG